MVDNMNFPNSVCPFLCFGYFGLYIKKKTYHFHEYYSVEIIILYS